MQQNWVNIIFNNPKPKEYLVSYTTYYLHWNTHPTHLPPPPRRYKRVFDSPMGPIQSIIYNEVYTIKLTTPPTHHHPGVVKEYSVLPWVVSASCSWTTWICLPRRNTEPNLLLNSWDNGWTTDTGTIARTQPRYNSRISLVWMAKTRELGKTLIIAYGSDADNSFLFLLFCCGSNINVFTLEIWYR